MADSKRKHDWSIASSQMALLAEVNRNHKKRLRPYKPIDFNPLMTPQSRPIPITVAQLGKLLSLPVQNTATSCRDNSGNT